MRDRLQSTEPNVQILVHQSLVSPGQDTVGRTHTDRCRGARVHHDFQQRRHRGARSLLQPGVGLGHGCPARFPIGRLKYRHPQHRFSVRLETSAAWAASS